jgi:hypothetical protein
MKDKKNKKPQIVDPNQKPIDKLAKEIVDVINEALNADKNGDGKIKGIGEITSLIFASISEVPDVAKAMNETVAYYKGKDIPVQNVIIDVMVAIGQALTSLDIEDKSWIPPVIETNRAVVVSINAGATWANYANTKKK